MIFEIYPINEWDSSPILTISIRKNFLFFSIEYLETILLSVKSELIFLSIFLLTLFQIKIFEIALENGETPEDCVKNTLTIKV